MAELPSNVSWTQDEDSVEVTVDVPDAAVRADLRVKTQADTLAVHLKGGDGAWRPVVIGHLRHSVEHESCCWALEKKKGRKVIVIQLEKKAPQTQWDALLRASTSGSILEELGRDQVIVDAGASTAESVVCGRCGALVKASRIEAHATMWCDAIVAAADEGDDDDKGGASEVLGTRGAADVAPVDATDDGEEAPKSAAAHLYWARAPTNPAGAVPPKRLGRDAGGALQAADGAPPSTTAVESGAGVAAIELEPSCPAAAPDEARPAPSTDVRTLTVTCELSEARGEAAATEAARLAAATAAEGHAQWLHAFWFAPQQRKHGAQLERVGRSGVRVTAPAAGPEEDSAGFGERWRKLLREALKKVEVEDLGAMDATRLWEAIPEEDGAGRGRRDLAAMEKELSVKAAFCANEHVVLVGAKPKLAKKCFAMRNLLSHYHWRLSGRDVAFEAMTATR